MPTFAAGQKPVGSGASCTTRQSLRVPRPHIQSSDAGRTRRRSSRQSSRTQASLFSERSSNELDLSSKLLCGYGEYGSPDRVAIGTARLDLGPSLLLEFLHSMLLII